MNTTLAARLMPVSNVALRNVALAVAGSLLVAAAAQVTVPFWPVPMTLQVLAVLLVGGAFGARLGAATIGLYALEGAAGLPFFAGGKAGFDYLLHSPTMGYVAGFMVAAAVVGAAAQRGLISSPFKMVGATVLGAALVYGPGLAWLAAWFAFTKGMDASAAASATVTFGLVPFLLGDAVKAVIAGLALAGGWAALKR